MNNYFILNNKDICIIKKSENGIKIETKDVYDLKLVKKMQNDENTYDHWMLKEIMEQPMCINRALNNGGRISGNTTVKLGGLETFKNQKNAPALIMKTSSAGFSVMDRESIKDKIQMIKDNIKHDTLPEIYLLHGDLTDEEMNQMYNHPKVKAHLTFTHGEGFGRPLLEASFSGKPIVAPISTGQADFLDRDYSVELPHTMTKIPQSAFPAEYFHPEAKWSTVNYGLSTIILKDVFKNYNK